MGSFGQTVTTLRSPSLRCGPTVGAVEITSKWQSFSCDNPLATRNFVGGVDRTLLLIASYFLWDTGFYQSI